MGKFVLDCSVTISWFMPDENANNDNNLLNQLADEGSIVPSLWKIEVANTLLVAQRRNRITSAHREKILHELEHLPIEIDNEMTHRAWHEISELAEKHSLTVYDSTYLELALRLELPLATYDKSLINACKRLQLATI